MARNRLQTKANVVVVYCITKTIYIFIQDHFTIINSLFLKITRKCLFDNKGDTFNVKPCLAANNCNSVKDSFKITAV